MTVSHIKQLAIIEANKNLVVMHASIASKTTCLFAQECLTTQFIAVPVWTPQMLKRN